jgi:hypothetical protein
MAAGEITITHLLVTRVSGRDSMQEYITLVVREKRTGSLQINFSQGVPGAVEWTEKKKQNGESQNKP